MQRIGRRGARSTLERHGPELLFDKSRAWRLEHPSDLERLVITALQALGLTDYEREAQALGADVLVAVDFCFWERRRIIEVNGAVHEVFGDPTDEAHRLRRLEDAGWSVLVLTEREVRDEALLAYLLRTSLDER